mmetsp:Transcript_5370/g.7910  ORF Transcript_5370/g.7910 Transcript_5370/m.7910 type:complete len:228 (+) Transcript_5370:2750-3433(+)
MPKDAAGEIIVIPADRNRYIVGRNGDHLVTPFQCDLCHFRNLMQRDPIEDLPSDVRLLKFIRRANLDAMWASEPKTVASTLSEARRGLSIAHSFGFRSSLFAPLGPFHVCTLSFSINSIMWSVRAFTSRFNFCSATVSSSKCVIISTTVPSGAPPRGATLSFLILHKLPSSFGCFIWAFLGSTSQRLSHFVRSYFGGSLPPPSPILHLYYHCISLIYTYRLPSLPPR